MRAWCCGTAPVRECSGCAAMLISRVGRLVETSIGRGDEDNDSVQQYSEWRSEDEEGEERKQSQKVWSSTTSSLCEYALFRLHGHLPIAVLPTKRRRVVVDRLPPRLSTLLVYAWGRGAGSWPLFCLQEPICSVISVGLGLCRWIFGTAKRPFLTCSAGGSGVVPCGMSCTGSIYPPP